MGDTPRSLSGLQAAARCRLRPSFSLTCCYVGPAGGSSDRAWRARGGLGSRPAREWCLEGEDATVGREWRWLVLPCQGLEQGDSPWGTSWDSGIRDLENSVLGRSSGCLCSAPTGVAGGGGSIGSPNCTLAVSLKTYSNTHTHTRRCISTNSACRRATALQRRPVRVSLSCGQQKPNPDWKWGWCCAAWLGRPPAAPASCISALVLLPAAPLPVWLLAHAPGKAAEDGSGAWAPATHVGTQMENPEGFSLAQTWLL